MKNSLEPNTLIINTELQDLKCKLLLVLIEDLEKENKNQERILTLGRMIRGVIKENNKLMEENNELIEENDRLIIENIELENVNDDAREVIGKLESENNKLKASTEVPRLLNNHEKRIKRARIENYKQMERY